MSTLPPNQLPPNQPNYADQPPRKSGALWWILGVLGVVLIGGGLLCCGGGYFAFQSGMDMMGQQLRAQVADDPLVVEHIGEIESLQADLTAAGERGEPGMMVYRVDGSKGSGLLVGRPAPGGRMTEVILVVDGQEYPLSDSAAPVEEATPADDAEAALEVAPVEDTDVLEDEAGENVLEDVEQP